MDNLTKYLNKISYKFPKGYPDMDDPQDKNMLFEMVTSLLENDADEAINILKKELNLTDENFSKLSSVRYKLLVPRAERFDYIKKIETIEGFEYDPNIRGSSIGGVTYKGSTFLLKPSGAQGRASAGTENEDILENEIKKYLEMGAVNVIFDAPNKSLTIKNVKDISGVGYDVAGGKKADLIIKGDKSYPSSVKKDNAGFWESSDTRYKDVVKKLSEKIKKGDFAPELVFKPFVDKLGREKEGINLMHDDRTDTKVTGVIVTDLPDKDEKSIIFGSDDAIVIYRSYSSKDFKLVDNNLYIEVSKIIENLKDVEEFNLEPILNIRHDSTRTATGGLRATVQPENKIYRDSKVIGNKIEIPYDKIMS